MSHGKIPSKRAEPPGGGDFAAWEKFFMQEHKNKLICDGCYAKSITSHGVGGNKSQMGYRLIQTRCSECGKSSRVETLLKHSQLDILLEEYTNKVKETNQLPRPAPSTKRALVQKNLTLRAKAKSTPATSSTAEAAPVVVTSSSTANIETEGTEDTQDAKETAETPLVTAQESKQAQQMKELIGLMIKQQEQLSSQQKQIDLLTAQLKQLLTNRTTETKTTPAITAVVTPKTNNSTKNTTVPKMQTTGKEAVDSPAKTSSKNKETKTFAEAVKMNLPKKTKMKENKLKRIAKQMWEPKEVPLEFTRFHIHLNDSRPLKKCKSKNEKRRVIYACLRSMGIRNHIIHASPVGNSIIEVYSIDKMREDMLDILDEKGIKNTLAPDLMKKPNFQNAKEVDRTLLIKRLGWIYFHATLQNLKKAVIQDMATDIQDEIIRYIPEYITNKEKQTTEDAPEVARHADMEVCEITEIECAPAHHE